MKKDNLVRASLVMLIFTIISKISGFLREQVFAYYYGASNLTDAYITATTISTTIFAGLTTAITIGYIPTISLFNKEKVSKVTSNIINLSVLVILSISLVVLMGIDEIIPFFAIGFSEETRLIAVTMSKIILPASFLYVIYNILNGFLQFNSTFWTLGIAVVINNVTNMVVFMVSDGNLNVLAYGFVFSWILPTIFFLCVCIKNGYKHSLTVNPRDESIKHIVMQGIPIFLGQLLFQFNTLIDRNFASVIGEGIMTNMKYANQLILFVTTIFAASIVTAIYPKLSKLASLENLEEYKKISVSSMQIILFFVIPITAAFFLLANPIVELVFMRGEFDATSANITANALKAYAFAIPGICMNEILNKQFYSLKDTKTPVMLNVISLTVNILFNFALISVLGYVGLALATALANTVLSVLLYLKLNKKIGGFGTKKLLISISKMSVSAFAMGISVQMLIVFMRPYFEQYSSIGNIVIISVSGLVGVILYFVFAYILKIEELQSAILFIKRKVFKNKA